jgi:YD repeat-containing protein
MPVQRSNAGPVVDHPPKSIQNTRFMRSLLLPEVILPICVLVFLLSLILYRDRLASNPSRQSPRVAFRSAAELASIKPEKDSYPCFVAERSNSASPLRAAIRNCVLSFPNLAPIEQYKVYLHSGYFTFQQTDLFISDRLPITITRGYWQWSLSTEAFGAASGIGYDIHPFGDRNPYTYMKLVLPDGNQVPFHRISQGTSYFNDVQEHTGTPATPFDRARIWWNGDHWDMRFADGTMYRFPEAYFSKRPAQAALVGMHDAAGNEVKFVREQTGNLLRVISPAGHWIDFQYDRHDRTISAKNDSGIVLTYVYDQLGRLSEVLRDSNILWQYSYEPEGIGMIRDSRGRVILTNHYHAGRIESMKLGTGGTYTFDYLYDRTGYVIETRIKAPQGKFTILKFEH